MPAFSFSILLAASSNFYSIFTKPPGNAHFSLYEPRPIFISKADSFLLMIVKIKTSTATAGPSIIAPKSVVVFFTRINTLYYSFFVFKVGRRRYFTDRYICGKN